MSSRRDEIAQKRAKLAELKRQREERQAEIARRQTGIVQTGQSPSRRSGQPSDLDDYLDGLLGKQPPDGASDTRNASTKEKPIAQDATPQAATRPSVQSIATQTFSTTSTTTVFEVAPAAPTSVDKEVISYSKGVQTEPWTDSAVQADFSDQENATRSSKRLSRREREKDGELRANLRREIEEELREIQGQSVNNAQIKLPQQERFPLRELRDDELNALTTSNEFSDFTKRATQVIERALDEDYDLLVDYTAATKLEADSDDESPYLRSTKKLRSLKQTQQLYSEQYTRRRQVTSLQFSPHFPELLATSYTKNSTGPTSPNGLVLLWNTHAPSRPEYTFTTNNDVLITRFSPFHPNLILGGCYSGQVVLWDTRTSPKTGLPVQKTPLSGSHLGHTHPIYSLSIIGTPNAHNILTTSTDGTLCSWSPDMLTHPQEHLTLLTPSPPSKTDDLAPSCLTFPATDPTSFVVGTEEGALYACHRYERAGAKAGVDNRLTYRGHTAPVMSAQFHPARGPVDTSDLLLSSSIDWSIKLWRIKAAGTAMKSANASTNEPPSKRTVNQRADEPAIVEPILDIPREDLVYDAQWHPHRPSIFAAVTGAGELEVFDLLVDSEVPVARAAPRQGTAGILLKGLNKVAWEQRRGAVVATGGLDGVVSLFDVGKGLQGGANDGVQEEWVDFRGLANRWDAGHGKELRL